MSYFDQAKNTYFADQGFSRNFVSSPMDADILAVAALYGLSTTTRTGDTTYGFHSNAARDTFDATQGGGPFSYTIFDSGGTDTLDYSGYAAAQLINLNWETFSNVGGLVGNVSIARGTVIENAIGGIGNDTLIGNAADNILDGRAGNDTLQGGAGNDRLIGRSGADTMSGGAGNDVYYADNPGDGVIENAGEGTDTVAATVSFTLPGNVERLVLQGSADVDGTGNSLNNIITGNSGDNLLDGGAGSDTLVGGAGIDTLAGGVGHDRFVFNSTGDTAVGASDSITDFATGDRIDLRPIDANMLMPGDQAFIFVGTSAFQNAAGELRYEQISGATYVEGDTNGDGLADFMIKLDGSHNLTGADFLV
jgi:Ca2+-binding RTX toxin-like protein